MKLVSKIIESPFREQFFLETKNSERRCVIPTLVELDSCWGIPLAEET